MLPPGCDELVYCPLAAAEAVGEELGPDLTGAMSGEKGSEHQINYVYEEDSNPFELVGAM